MMNIISDVMGDFSIYGWFLRSEHNKIWLIKTKMSYPRRITSSVQRTIRKTEARLEWKLPVV